MCKTSDPFPPWNAENPAVHSFDSSPPPQTLKLFIKTRAHLGLITPCKRLTSPASDANLYSDAKINDKATEAQDKSRA